MKSQISNLKSAGAPPLLLSLFDRIADAPDAIPRLRQFILDLAVRGKLVPQDPKDEPASELLQRIRDEQARLMRGGKIRRQEPQSPVSEADEPFPIPSNWAWTRLGQVGDWGSGSTPPRGGHGLYGGGIAWLKSGELNDNPSLSGSEETVTEQAVASGSFRRNKPGDVLIAMYGATIGKAAILAEPAVTNQAVCACSPFGGLLNHYLFKFLLSQRIQFHAQSEGGAQPNISKIKLLRFPFPLPSLAEQHRIVAKVDELMALCDRLEAAQAEREIHRNRLVAATHAHLSDSALCTPHSAFFINSLPRLTTRPEHIQQFRQTILNLAVQGKLVSQDPKDESPSELILHLARNRQTMVATGALRNIEPVSPVRDTEPFALPHNWAWAFPDQLSKPTSNALTIGPFGSNLVTADYTRSGTPLVFVSDIRSQFSGPPKHFVSAAKADTLKSHSVGPGDLLITKMGDPPGDTAIYPQNRPRAIITADCIKWTLEENLVSPRFLYFAIKTSSIAQQIIEITKGAAHQKVSLKRFRGVYLPIPPLSEQHRIVAKVDELMALCDRLEAQLTTTQTESRRLLESVLHQALSTSA